MGASAGQGEWDQGMGSSALPSSLELLLLPAQSPQPFVALIHIFIRINEACNKCIGEPKQAAERRRQWMTAGEEEDKAVYCAELGSRRKPHVHSLARAARSNARSLCTHFQIPARTCQNSSVCSCLCGHRHKAKERESYQRSAINV